MVNTNSLSRKASRKVDLRLARCDGHFAGKFSHRMKHAMTRQRLSATTGTMDEVLLDELQYLGFNENNIEALRYAPIVEVAWANGKVTQFERVFAVSAALSSDLLKAPAAFELFESWLLKRPEKALWSVWERFTVEELSGPDRVRVQQFGHRLLEIATRVALASGGLLDQGEICIAEQKVLDRITRVYGNGL